MLTSIPISINPYHVDYVVLAAMPEELNFLIESFSCASSIDVTVGSFCFKIYDYKNHKILIAYTGIGTAFAASILTWITVYFKPRYFFVSGTAGAIHENLKINDVIIIEKAFEAEMQDIFSAVRNTPFESCLIHPLKNQRFPSQYVADSELLQISHTLDFPDLTVYRGAVVSSNAFPAPKELFEKIKQRHPDAIDMETSAFYQIAWLLNIKILAVRGISNQLNSDGTDDNVHTSDVAGSSKAANRVVLSILNQLIFLGQSHEKHINKKTEFAKTH